MPIVPRFSIADAQRVLPLPKVAFEAHALGDLKRRDDAPLYLFARLPGSFARSPILPARLMEVGKQTESRIVCIFCPDCGRAAISGWVTKAATLRKAAGTDDLAGDFAKGALLNLEPRLRQWMDVQPRRHSNPSAMPPVTHAVMGPYEKIVGIAAVADDAIDCCDCGQKWIGRKVFPLTGSVMQCFTVASSRFVR